jgi:16S rRNA (cytosine1402-N4)-methyltransferase
VTLEIEAMQREGAHEEPDAVHVPVLAAEVVEWISAPLGASFDGWVVDGTLGAGGHARLLLEALPRASLLGIDQDPEALEHARAALEPYRDRVRIRRARLSELGRTIRKERVGRPAGMLLDLGASSLQLDLARRGFSFQKDGPLDMRMDPDRERTAADIVNRWDESDLADLFYYEGGETRARKAARAVVQARRNAPFLRTGALADTLAEALGHGGRTHPATRVFQALRRAVNEEGEELLAGLAAAEHWLAPGARPVVISFHSGEDREVKRFLADGAAAGRWRVLTRRPVTPDRTEERANRRARSARLRAGERTDLAPADLAALRAERTGVPPGAEPDELRGGPA